MEEKSKDAKEIIKEEQIEQDALELAQNIIENNEVEFELKGTKYRVKKPTFGQRMELSSQRTKKYLELLEEEDKNGNKVYKLEEDLIEEYKKRGVDLDEEFKVFKNLQLKKDKWKLKLGEAIEKGKDKSVLDTFEKEINELDEKQKEISYNRSSKLEHSVENQVSYFLYSYVAYLVSEELKDDKWVRVWESYDDLLNSDEEIVNTCTLYSSYVSAPSYKGIE